MPLTKQSGIACIKNSCSALAEKLLLSPDLVAQIVRATTQHAKVVGSLSSQIMNA